jgi:SAM-dependent methyltransferase
LNFRVADATALPFPDASFDGAVSVQVFEYVKDIAAALSEVYRVLRPGGRAVIVDTDWDSIAWNASDRVLMQRVLRAWDEHLFDPDYDENSISAGLIGLISGFVPGRSDDCRFKGMEPTRNKPRAAHAWA